ncbi:MAG TPA: Zn-ribbon domain-containing OB-fold protein [bacterium]|nr:Zn-ribbon domain-containing OB-fold protein [bacterium]
MPSQCKNAYEVLGKLEIPYKYTAGKTGSLFLTTLRDHKKIMATRCEKCKTVFVPPRSVCDRCYLPVDKWVEVGPAGTVTSFTVVRYYEPYLPMKPPFVMAQIKLDGADTSLTHLLSEIKPEDVRIGLRVQPVFAANPQARITDIAYFKPLAKAAPARKSPAAAPAKKAKAAKPSKKAAKKVKRAAKPAKKASKPAKKAPKKAVKKYVSKPAKKGPAGKSRGKKAGRKGTARKKR